VLLSNNVSLDYCHAIAVFRYFETKPITVE
jgi:hypothetical protein